MDRQLFDRLTAWLDDHFDELVDDLKGLVAIPSVAVYDDPDTPYGPHCRDALRHMLALAEKHGFRTASWEDRYGMLTRRDKAENIAVWNHLDVVPPGDGWTLTGPYEPIVKDGFLIGRGADDNKGPAVGVMYMLRAIEELGVPTRHGLRLYVGCDEEQGMSDVAHFAASHPADKLTLIADCGFPVCYGEKGIMTAELVSAAPVTAITRLEAGVASNIVPDKAHLTLRGTARLPEAEGVEVTGANGETRLFARGMSAHSAFPQGGVNAIHRAMAAALDTGLLCGAEETALAFMKRINDDVFGTALGIAHADDVSGSTTCAGTMARLLPDGRISMHLNIRYCITDRADRMIAAMESACRENGCTLENVTDSAPNYFPREHPVVDALTGLYNELTGQNAAPYVMGGGTYARKLHHAVGFGLGGLAKPETDLFAPGHGGAHQPDEGRHLETFKQALVIFAMGLLEADRII